ncbi:hypothetical protein D1631_03835 [Chryseobacterium nematophagum]|uniref:DUF748 domain-containing protein n=1 Tax=Chryseobacterium nematophagum TaxID=2305228 RepID=A0A3M7TCC5_9FLAO|nr:hypothetical protein [Chryseobacterium nematophagum]RNA61125.1 hypothetical protein D1631_03835 [Chryseobacterium nematophagum]
MGSKKKWVKRLLFGFGVLFIILLLANFGLNLWLKTQLPDYIKNNTDYKISYKTIEVDLGNGSVFSTGISISNKDPQNNNILGLQGTIDTLRMSRFGMYKAIFNDEINSSDLLLARPNLDVTLAKPVDHKTNKKRKEFLFENITIRKGRISIFKSTRQKFLSVDPLDLHVENLQLTEESVKNKLPIIFDQYSIKGGNFFFRPNNIYALKIKNVETINGQISIEGLRLIPLLTVDQFKRFYSRKANMVKGEVRKMRFKNVVLDNNKISITHAYFQNPNFSVYRTNALPQKANDFFPFEIDLNEMNMNNGAIQVMKADGTKAVFARNINMKVDQLKLEEKKTKEAFPFDFKNFQISGKDILFSDHEDYKIGDLALNTKSGELRNISVISNNSSLQERKINVSIDHIAFNLNKLKFINQKLNIDVKDLLVENSNGAIKESKLSRKDTKTDLKGVQFPVLIRKVTLKNANISYEKNNQELKLNELNASLNNIEFTSKAKTGKLGINVKDYIFTTKNLGYNTTFYRLSIMFLKWDKNSFHVDNFAMKPLVSRAHFVKMIPVERDLYDLKVEKIFGEGDWNIFSQNKFIYVSQLTIQKADANIFRSKIPKDDPKEKLLYSGMLRSIKLPLYVKNLDVKNSVLVYEEDTPESVGPGKLTFSNFNMNVKNLNSAKMKGKPTLVDIDINCSFMKLAPLAVNWNFDVADTQDVFTISGRTINLPARGINPFIRPYLHIMATGSIQEMLFSFKGNPSGLNGSFNLRHKDLKVAILDKNNQEKKGLLTAVANLLVKSTSSKLPETVMIEGVERDPTKSFFNLFWKGIELGLKKTLISKHIERKERKLKKVVSDVKKMKKNVQEIKQEIKKTK